MSSQPGANGYIGTLGLLIHILDRLRPLRMIAAIGQAEKILTSKRSLEGERKQVAVLFADLKASLELLADRDPGGYRLAPSSRRS